MGTPTRKTFRLASSHMITTCATAAALLLFVALGSQVLPGGSTTERLTDNSLEVAFILNTAIVLFGWRRSKDLKEALDAHDASERAARSLAYSDYVTGLRNRRGLIDALDEALEDRRSGTLVLLDLDHFKQVNDLHGHAVGDDLLKAISTILIEEAPDGACCARIGGDEFAMSIFDKPAATAELVAHSILRRLAEPVQLGSVQAHVSCSIGLASFAGAKSDDVLRCGDIAMYAAKSAGRNTIAWFDSALEHQLRDRAKLEEDIRTGIAAREFVPFFQPLIGIETGRLIGFEVLARWRSPSRGTVEPDQFIRQAERAGMIDALSMSVMEQALVEAREWPGHLKISVNVSPLQFRDPTLPERIIQLLTRTGFSPRRLEVEITETSLLEDPHLVATTVQSLKNQGISISLDDFGTGYASLAQLRSLPFDRIKIDKSFIGSIGTDEHSAAIVATIAALGKTLSMSLTAEGVESQSVRQELIKLGCGEAQGWLFGRAVSARTVREYLQLQDAPEDLGEPGGAFRSSAG